MRYVFYMTAKICQVRSKQKKFNSIFLIISTYFRHDRKWRIIYNRTPFRIIKPFVISTRPERTNDFFAVDAIFRYNPIQDRKINIFWRIAVVRCFLWLEFIEKCFVFFIYIIKS